MCSEGLNQETHPSQMRLLPLKRHFPFPFLSWVSIFLHRLPKTVNFFSLNETMLQNDIGMMISWWVTRDSRAVIPQQSYYPARASSAPRLHFFNFLLCFFHYSLITSSYFLSSCSKSCRFKIEAVYIWKTPWSLDDVVPHCLQLSTFSF